KAVVIGYNVRPTAAATDLADQEKVEVRLYRVIYEAIDDIRAALSGLLAPEEQVNELGTAEVRALFRVPRIGTIAGCYVTRGTITRGGRARLVRDGVIIYESTIGSLRRFKDDVREVAEGFECGIGIEGYNDVQEGDVIEAYEIREVAGRCSVVGDARRTGALRSPHPGMRFPEGEATRREGADRRDPSEVQRLGGGGGPS